MPPGEPSRGCKNHRGYQSTSTIAKTRHLKVFRPESCSHTGDTGAFLFPSLTRLVFVFAQHNKPERPAYTKRQQQCRVTTGMALATCLSLKSMETESLQNGVADHFGVTPLISMISATNVTIALTLH